MIDVRHVPSFKINLIYVGQLASSEHTTTFTGNMWKVTKGALVIARGKKIGILYLIGKNISIDIAKTDANSNTWHCRLGYISEKGMKIR